MNRRDALRAVAEDLLGALARQREEFGKYGHALADSEKDRERIELAHVEMEYRLQRVAYRGVRRKAKVTPPDPNQVALFE